MDRNGRRLDGAVDLAWLQFEEGSVGELGGLARACGQQRDAGGEHRQHDAERMSDPRAPALRGEAHTRDPLSIRAGPLPIENSADRLVPESVGGTSSVAAPDEAKHS